MYTPTPPRSPSGANPFWGVRSRSALGRAPPPGFQGEAAGTAAAGAHAPARARRRTGDAGATTRKLWPDNTFVDFDRGLNKAINRLRDVLRDDADKPRFIETLPHRGYRFIAPVEGRPVGSANTGRVPGRPVPQPVPRIDSLAVLPLDNHTGDPGQEYFSDGMTEELITAITMVSSLRVISRTSVMRYKGVRKSLPAIARELRVDGVVEGSVARSDQKVRITAQLIHAPTDRHLWSGRYERNCGMSCNCKLTSRPTSPAISIGSWSRSTGLLFRRATSIPRRTRLASGESSIATR